MLRIGSKKNGFRRCGVEFSEIPVDYPDDKFTTDEIKILKAEPMLVVVEVPDEPKDEDPEDKIGELSEQKPDKKQGKK